MATLNTYVTEHYGQPGIPESAYYCTTVTTEAIPVETLAKACSAKTPDPALRFWHHELHYPQVPADPRAGLKMVEDTYRDCARCHLSNRRTRVVHFRGDPDSPVVLLGEGPGRSEDTQGIPFCGPAGRLQDHLLGHSHIEPNSLAWMNLVGCRPCIDRFKPDRPPTLTEKAACSERTTMLLRALRPSVVVCLGQVPCSMFWDSPPEPWTWHQLADGLVVGHARHPAYLARRLRVKGGEAERQAALRFYSQLRERMPQLRKLPMWTAPARYLGEVQGRVVVGT